MAKNKKKKEEKTSFQKSAQSRRLILKVTCGSCCFLKQKAKGFAAPCEELGKNKLSATCKSYTPNYVEVRQHDPYQLMEIGKMIRDLPTHIQHLVAFSIVNGQEMSRVVENIRGKPIKFGQPVVVNLASGQSDLDYINCWHRGIAIGVSSDKKFIIIIGKIIHNSGKVDWGQISLQIDSYGRSYMDLKEWRKHKKKLVKAGKINIPKGQAFPQITIETARSSDYKPQPIPKAPKKARNMRMSVDKYMETYHVRETEHGKVIEI